LNKKISKNVAALIHDSQEELKNANQSVNLTRRGFANPTLSRGWQVTPIVSLVRPQNDMIMRPTGCRLLGLPLAES